MLVSSFFKGSKSLGDSRLKGEGDLRLVVLVSLFESVSLFVF